MLLEIHHKSSTLAVQGDIFRSEQVVFHGSQTGDKRFEDDLEDDSIDAVRCNVRERFLEIIRVGLSDGRRIRLRRY